MSSQIEFSVNWRVSTIQTLGEFASQELGAGQAPMAAPDSVRSGATFPVQIYTFWGGCDSRTDSVAMMQRGDTTLLIPYDELITPLRAGNYGCIDVLYFGSRTAYVTIGKTGPKVLEVRGWREDAPAGLLSYDKSVYVSP
ncbi:MAG TPA: hypothetical protein VLT79_10655 [Gemmatimonadales bacterium]|nr:hypothetical protein [Gemmatimonadales bacterium]